jgi:hypothetical protein
MTVDVWRSAVNLPTKVYVVSSGEYEGNHIEAIFSSKENADEYISLTEKHGTPERWGSEPSIEEWSVDAVEMIPPEIEKLA